jgi:hypothetical protein
MLAFDPEEVVSIEPSIHLPAGAHRVDAIWIVGLKSGKEICIRRNGQSMVKFIRRLGRDVV